MVAYLNFGRTEAGRLHSAILLQELTHIGRDLVKCVKLLFILHELVSVNLVDEHFESDERVNLMRHLDDLEQLVAGDVFVGLVSIDHIDERAALAEGLHILRRQILELLLPRKVLNLELNVWVIRIICRFDCCGRR